MKLKTQKTNSYNIDKLIFAVCSALPFITIILACVIFGTLICGDIPYGLLPKHIQATIFATILIAIISTLILADNILSYVYTRQSFIVKDSKTQYFIDDVEVTEEEFTQTKEKEMKHV